MQQGPSQEEETIQLRTITQRLNTISNSLYMVSTLFGAALSEDIGKDNHPIAKVRGDQPFNLKPHHCSCSIVLSPSAQHTHTLWHCFQSDDLA